MPAPSKPLLARTLELLSAIEDDQAAALIEDLALANVAFAEKLLAYRAVYLASLGHCHSLHADIVRLEKQRADLCDELRRLRAAQE